MDGIKTGLDFLIHFHALFQIATIQNAGGIAKNIIQRYDVQIVGDL